MKVLKFSAAIAAAVSFNSAFAADAQQQQDKYLEIGHTSIKAHSDGLTLSPTALRFVAGYGITDTLAAEAMLMAGLTEGSASASYNGVTYKIGVTPAASYGIFLKPRMKFGQANDSEIFGRLGYFNAKFDVTEKASGGGQYAAATWSSGESGVAFGAGAKLSVAKDAHLTFDYMRYLEKDGVKIDGVTVGLAKSFN